MASENQENFLRVAIIVVDHAKESFIELLEVHLSNVGLTFEQFINQNQHEIFHLFNNSRCCKCHGRNTSRNSRVIFAPQMNILFDKATQCNAGRCLDFCCCSARTGVVTKDLDMTLAKCLLINFCSEVFWYASLNFLGQTLEQFLNIHKHDIYHMWQNSVSCCECDPTTPTPIRRGFLNSLQWNHMFKSTSIPCINHRKRPASGTVNCICSMKSITGISLAQIDAYTQDVLIKQCCIVRKAIDSLTSIRNERYGHISEGRISNNEYHSLITEIERGIIEIAKVCKKERYFEAKLKMAKTQTLSMDYVTNEKYKQKILEVLSNSVEIEMHLTNQDSTLEAIRGKAKRIPTEIVSKIPKIVDESTQHISRTVQENFANQREMVEKYGNKLRQYCDLTLMDIKSHWSEGTFVETEEVRRCVSEIKENDVMIIYGRTGSGKTRTGLEILRQLGELDQSYHLVKILDIQQVNDVLMTGVNIALLLDDLFCFEFKSREGLVWNSVFDRLYSCKMNICIKIICTVKTSFKKSISQYFQSKRIFLNRFEIDLESASLSIAEKSEILSRFCNRFEIDVEWNIPSENKRRKLDSKIFFEIVKYKTFLPLATSYFLFTSEPKNFCLGLSFFKHPPEYLIESINTLRDAEGVLVSQIKYSILVLTLMKGHFARNSPEDLNRLSKFMSECYNVSQNKTLKIKMEKAIDELDGEYLEHDDHSPMYTFKHRMVTEAVSVSYFDIDPEVVISVIDVDFMVEMVGLLNDKNGTSKLGIYLSEDLYDHFCEKLFDQYTSCSRTKQRDIVKRFSKSKLIQRNNMEFVGSVVRVIQRFDNIENDPDDNKKLPVYFLLDMIEFLSRNIDATDVVKVLINGLKKSPKFQNSLAIIGSSIESTLQYVCESGNHGSLFDIIVEFTKDSKLTIDVVQCLFAAVETDNEIIFNALITEFPVQFTYVDLVHESDDQNLPLLVNLLSKTFLGYPCCNLNRTTIAQWLLSQSHTQCINYQTEVEAALKRELSEIVDWLVQNRSDDLPSLTSIVDQACCHCWENVLISVLKRQSLCKDHCNRIFNTACENNSLTLLRNLSCYKHMFVNDLKNKLTELYRLQKHEAIAVIITEYDIALRDLTLCFKDLVERFGANTFKIIVSRSLSGIRKCGVNNRYKPICLALCLHLEGSVQLGNVLEIILHRVNDGCQVSELVLSDIRNITGPENLKQVLVEACKLKLVNISTWFLQTYNDTDLDLKTLLERACTSENVGIIKTIVRNVKHVKFNMDFVVIAALKGCWNGKQKEYLEWILENINHNYVSWDTVLHAALEYPSSLSLVLNFVNEQHVKPFMQMKNEKLYFALMTTAKLRHLLQCEQFSELMKNGFSDDFVQVMAWLQNIFDTHRCELSTVFSKACQDNRNDVIFWFLKNADLVKLQIKSTDIRVAVEHALQSYITEVGRTRNDGLKAIALHNVLSFLRLVLQNIDHGLLDFGEIVFKACKVLSTDILNLLVENCGDFDVDLHIVTAGLMSSQTVMYNSQQVNTFFEGLFYMFDVNETVHCIYDKDRHAYESCSIIKMILCSVDMSKLDVKFIMNEACARHQLDVVKILLDKADHTLFDVNDAVHCIYEENDENDGESSSMIQLLLSGVDTLRFDVKYIMNEACRRYQLDVIKILLNTADHSLLDVNKSMQCIYLCMGDDTDDKELSSFIQQLLSNVDISRFDVKYIMHEACMRCQLDVVKILLDRADHSLFDVNEDLEYLYYWMNYCEDDSELSTLIALFLSKGDISRFDVKFIMNEACRRYQLDVIKILLEKANHLLLDVNKSVHCIYEYNDAESSPMIQLLLSGIDILRFDVKYIMKEACKRCQLDVIEMLLDRADHSLLDVNEVVRCIYNYYGGGGGDNDDDSKSSSLIEFLLSRIDISRIDVKYIMYEACTRSQLDVVKMLLEKVDHSLLDVNEVVRCIYYYYVDDYGDGSNTFSMFQCLLSSIDISRFDVQYIMKEACKRCQLDVVKMFLEKADHSLLNVNEVVRCIYYDNDFDDVSKTSLLIQCLLSKIDISRFDVKYIMDKACERCQLDVVKILLEKADHSLLNVNEVVRWIYYDNDFDDVSKTSLLIQCLLSKVDISRFDVKYIMDEACERCQLNVIKILLEKADHSLLNVNEVVRCIYNDNDNDDDYDDDSKTSSLIQCLLSRIDISRFDVEYIMIEACFRRQLDVVKILLEKADHSLLNVNEVVRWIYYDNDFDDVSKTSLLIQCLLSRIDISRFDVKYIMDEACERCQLDVIKILLEKADHSLLNVNEVVRCIYNDNDNDDDYDDDSKTSSLIQCLLSRIDISRFDVEYIMIEACFRRQLDVIKILLDRADHSLLNVNEVVRCIYYSYDDEYDDEYDDDSKRSSLIQVLLSSIDISRFDVKYIMDKACERCQPDVVKILLDKADHSLFDVNRAVKLVYNNSYCDQKKASLIIDLLLSEFDISVFDAKFLMNESCRGCHNEVVEILLQKKFPDLNMKSAVINMCRGDNLKGLNYVLNEYPESKYDLDKCLIVACRYGSIDVAKWLMATEQFSENCLITALRNASRCGRIRVVKLLVENSVFTLINIQEAINDALKSDYDSEETREVYFYLVFLRKSELDFDVLFNEVCDSGRIDILTQFVNSNLVNFDTSFNAVVTLYNPKDRFSMLKIKHILIQMITETDFHLLDVKVIFLQLCSKGHTEVLDHLIKGFGMSNLEQISQSALTTASNNGQLETVNWILNKIDNSLLDLKVLIIDACAYGWIHIIERNKQLLETNINECLVEACNFKRLDILCWISKNMEWNRLEIDVQHVLLTSCTNGWEEIYDWIMVKSCDKPLPVDECVTQACIHGHVSLVKKLYTSFGSQYFNLNLIYHSILLDKRNGDVLNFLLTTFGHQIIKLQDVLMAACQFGWLPVVEYVFRDLSKMEDSDEILNVPLAFRLACDNGESDIVKLFLAQLSIDDNDVKYAMKTSCEKGWDEIVSALLAMVDQQKLNVTDCLLKACESGESEVVDIILKNGNINILIKGQCMKKAITSHMNEQTTLVILKSCDEANIDFDIEEVKTKARVYRWTSVLSFFNEEISDDYLEMIVD